jgi:hypothetical protein
VYIDAEESEAWQKKLAGAGLITHKNSIIKDPVSFLKKTPVYTFYQKLLKNPFLRKKLLSAKGNIPRPLIYFDKNAFEIHACKGKVDISKIKKELGFEPAFTFSGGMKKTLSWIEWSNLNLET